MCQWVGLEAHICTKIKRTHDGPAPRRGTGPFGLLRSDQDLIAAASQLPVSFSRSAARASSEARVPWASDGADGAAEDSALLLELPEE